MYKRQLLIGVSLLLVGVATLHDGHALVGVAVLLLGGVSLLLVGVAMLRFGRAASAPLLASLKQR